MKHTINFLFRLLWPTIAAWMLLLLNAPGTLFAASHYVRAGATGSNTGADWNNAWTNVTAINWASVAPGDSIWLAGGSYGNLRPDQDGATNNPIYIARVRTTNSTPAAAAGWDAAFDATVTIDGMYATKDRDWWTVDGQIPHAGIVVTNSNWEANIIQFSSDTANWITLKNLLVTGGATNQTMSGLGEVRGINANFYVVPGRGLTVSDCTFQQVSSHVIISKWSEVVFERCKFWHNYAGNSGNHPNVLAAIGCTNVIFRWNEISEFLTEGIMFCFSAVTDAPNDTWDIYGNVWHDEIAGWYGRILESQYVPQYRIRFFNNTVANVTYGILRSNGGTWDGSCQSSNNISMGSGNLLVQFVGGSNGYNLSDLTLTNGGSISGASTNVFVDYAGKDYRIVSTIGALYPRDKGENLGTSYAVDFAGNTRTGTWDLGAYEYAASSPATTNGSTIGTAHIGTLIITGP